MPTSIRRPARECFEPARIKTVFLSLLELLDLDMEYWLGEGRVSKTTSDISRFLRTRGVVPEAASVGKGVV